MVDDHEAAGQLTSLDKERKRYEFLKGPVPWMWLHAAMCTHSHAALCLALAIWHQATCERTRTIKLRRRWQRELGLSPEGVRGGLRRLRDAGLITVHFRPRCRAEVTILQ